MTVEQDIVLRVYKGFGGTPELQAALAVYNRSTLQQFREYLREIQDIYKRLYEQKALKLKDNNRFTS